MTAFLFNGSISYAHCCDAELLVLKNYQDRIERKKTIRNVTGIVGFFCWPLWIVTGVEHSKVSRLKRDAVAAEVAYRSCMDQHR
jgi:hypothetical protein